MTDLDRRLLLKGAAVLPALAALGIPLSAFAENGGLGFGNATPFSFEALTARAKEMATQAYVPPEKPAPEVTAKLGYEQLGKIKFKTDHALWANGPPPFPATFFHLGSFFQRRVAIHVVEGQDAREILYEKAYFDMPPDSPAHEMPEGAGFAGFRFQESRAGKVDWRNNDWVAFLGASYFRSIGELYQYGLSARGLAVNAANPNPPFDEEFPDFKEFWLEAVPNSTDQVRVYALLDGPSVSGAFAFLMTRSTAVLMDI